jgi:hypothetical protein
VGPRQVQSSELPPVHPAMEANERAVIGAILTEPRSVLPRALRSGVSAGSFTTVAAKTIWRVFEERGVTEPYQVSLACGGGPEEAEFWLAAIEACFRDCLTAAHAPHYIELLRKAEAARNLSAALFDAQAALAAHPDIVWDICKRLAAELRMAQKIKAALEAR